MLSTMRYQPAAAAFSVGISPLRCLIVDNEPRAVATLAACVQQAPGLALAGTGTCPEQAQAFLQTQAIDVLFLSVELPLLAGLALLRAQGTGPAVVLMSNYPDYNLQEYGAYGVVDYLLKPMCQARFQQVAARLGSQRGLPQKPALATSPLAYLQTDGLYFRVNRQLVQVRLAEVLYVEDLSGRTRIKTTQQEFITDLTFATLTEQLPEPQFLRVNPTFVVALRQAAPVSGHTLAVGGRRIAVGSALQDEVLARAFQTNLWGA
ncbi:MAG: response regulator [Hymenobacter sp.]|nr:MAG: response regulator [Hymenobacter sp.]